MKDNHAGFGYTNEPYPHYACFCGYPVSAPLSPVSTNHPASTNMIRKMKEAWHAHKLTATNQTN